MNWFAYTASSDGGAIYPIFYERMKSGGVVGLERELLGLCEFLHVRVEPGRLRCVLSQSEGHFHRQGGSLLERVKFPFDEEQSNLIVQTICNVTHLLRSRGHEDLPIDLYNKEMSVKFDGSEKTPVPVIIC